MRDKVMGGAAKIGDEQSDKSTSTNTQKANIALKRVILLHILLWKEWQDFKMIWAFCET